MLVLLLALGLARAEEGAGEEPVEDASEASEEAGDDEEGGGWIELSAPVDFGSAIDDLEPLDQPDAPDLRALAVAYGDELGDDEREGPRLRARWALRPYLGATGLAVQDGGWGGRAGLVVGHQWWSLTTGKVRPAGHTELQATLPFGALRGWEVGLDATAGAWLGPVGLLAGPSMLADRQTWRDGAQVQPALDLGPQARLAVRLGPLVPWAAATPSWLLVGDRPGLDAPWDQLRVTAGLAIDSRPLAWRLSGSWRDLAAGPAWEAALGVHLKVM